MGSTPAKYHVAGAPATRSLPRAAAANARQVAERRPRAVRGFRRLCRRPEARSGRRHHLCGRAAQAGAAVAASGVARRRRSRRRLPTMCAAWGGCIPIYAQLRDALATHAYTSDQQRQLLSAQPRARARAAGRQAALRPGQRRAAAALHVRERQAGRLDGRGRRQAQISDADDRRPTSASQPQPLLVRAARSRRRATSRQYVLKHGLKYLDDHGYEVVSDWTPNSDDHRPQDGRLERRSPTARSRS